MNWILFTWELSKKSKQRRWFYTRLERIFLGLPSKSWRKLGGSVYIIERKYSHELEELLEYFEGPDLSWHTFEIKTRRNT